MGNLWPSSSGGVGAGDRTQSDPPRPHPQHPRGKTLPWGDRAPSSLPGRGNKRSKKESPQGTEIREWTLWPRAGGEVFSWRRDRNSYEGHTPSTHLPEGGGQSEGRTPSPSAQGQGICAGRQTVWSRTKRPQSWGQQDRTELQRTQHGDSASQGKPSRPQPMHPSSRARFTMADRRMYETGGRQEKPCSRGPQPETALLELPLWNSVQL